ncbi:unnamed protein product, partial [Iphiclides podalirius]
MVVSVRCAAGTSSASMYAMSCGGARSRERKPAAEWADSRSSKSSSVDLNARTTRSCNQHNPPSARTPLRPVYYTLAAAYARLPTLHTRRRRYTECGVDVLERLRRYGCIQSTFSVTRTSL